MSQDNQLCSELGAIVYEVLLSIDELLFVSERFLELYQPKLQEEADEFISLGYDLPDSVGLLCDLQRIVIPDEEESYDSVARLRDMAFDVATRMVSVSVIIKDIITMYVEPHENDTYIYIYLTMLNSVSYSIGYMREQLDKLHKQTSQLWPEMIVSDVDDTDEDEESVLPIEVESFRLMRSMLIKAFTEYTNEHKSERIADFFVAIQGYLEAFSNGIEPDEEFDFGFVLKTGNENRENLYIDFHFESEMLQVSSGGSIHTEFNGSDSYTNWIYSIWLNGRDDYDNNCCFSDALELVQAGAQLTIDNPDEYIDDQEDE